MYVKFKVMCRGNKTMNRTNTMMRPRKSASQIAVWVDLKRVSSFSSFL